MLRSLWRQVYLFSIICFRIGRRKSSQKTRKTGRPSARWLYDNGYPIGYKAFWKGWKNGYKYLRKNKNGIPFLSPI